MSSDKHVQVLLREGMPSSEECTRQAAHCSTQRMLLTSDAP